MVFAEQCKITRGLGYNLVLKSDNVDNGNFKENAVAAAKNVGKNFAWLVENLTLNLDNQQVVADQVLADFQTKLNHEERTASREKYSVMVQLESGEKKTSWVIVWSTESESFDEQTRDTSAFDWMLYHQLFVDLELIDILIIVWVFIIQKSNSMKGIMEMRTFFSNKLKIR